MAKIKSLPLELMMMLEIQKNSIEDMRYMENRDMVMQEVFGKLFI